jgi:hypothetical protein
MLSGIGSTSDLLKTGPRSPMRWIGRFRIIDAEVLKSKGRFQNFLELHLKNTQKSVEGIDSVTGVVGSDGFGSHLA